MPLTPCVTLPYAADCRDYFATLQTLPYPLWLDSGLQPHPNRRIDVLSAGPTQYLYCDRWGQTWLAALDAQGQMGHSQPLEQTPLRWLAQQALPSSDFHGLWAGYLSYDYGVYQQGITLQATALPQPPFAEALHYPWQLRIDHTQRQAHLYFGPQCSLAQRQAIVHRLTSASAPFNAPSLHCPPCQPAISPADYAQQFARIQQHLHQGDCYQVNLTQPWYSRLSGEPWQAYCHLRTQVSAPFSVFCQTPTLSLLSFSPERFIAVDQGRVESKPIKGTCRRAADPVQDRQQRQQLLASVKDRAENVMIVDLLRNDLSRVAQPHSVTVPQLCALESFAQVHHLVSTVQATLQPQLCAYDALAMAFPGGSITGAPKHRAMQIIAKLEPQPRGLYCGSFFYSDGQGKLDSNILIRTIQMIGDHLRCDGGGGITVDSDCASEYQESLNKVAALMACLEH